MSKKIKDIISKLKPFSEYPIDFMVMSIKTKNPQPDGSDVITLLHGSGEEIMNLILATIHTMRGDLEDGEQTQHN